MPVEDFFLAALCLGGAAPAKSHNCLFLDRQGGEAIARARTALFIDRQGEKGFHQEPKSRKTAVKHDGFCVFLTKTRAKRLSFMKTDVSCDVFEHSRFTMFFWHRDGLSLDRQGENKTGTNQSSFEHRNGLSLDRQGENATAEKRRARAKHE